MSAASGVRVGYVVPNSWGVERLDDVVALGVRAEELGVDSLWVSHHVLHVGFVGERLGTGPYQDPLVTLTVAAGATSRVRLGISVLVAPYVHPVPTAKTLATIDQLSGGRVEVAIGIGGLRVEHDAIGQVPWSQRARYTDEFIDVLRLLWSGESSSYAGRHFRFDGVHASPTPVDTIPVFVGGSSDGALARAAARGDGWHPTGLDPAEVAARRATLDQQLSAAGRDPAAFPTKVRLHIDVGDADPASWRERLAAYRDAGVDEVLLAPQSGDLDGHEAWLTTLSSVW